MELQQPNPSEKASIGYTKLNDDENNPSASAQQSSCSQEENIYQRAFVSVQKDSKSSSQIPQKSQIKELSSWLTIFYYAMLVIDLYFSVIIIGSIIYEIFEGLEFNKLGFFCTGWRLTQCVLAFYGIRKRNLSKISNAFFMMKLYYLLTGFIYANDQLEAHKKASDKKEEGSEPLVDAVIGSIFFTIMLVLPTWRIRNFLKSLPEDYEEMRKEQAQDSDPIEKLGSLWFTLYKYGLLLLFCVQAKSLVSGGLQDFSDVPRLFEKILSERSFLVSKVIRYLAVPLRGIFMFLLFEGIRRKNLEKIIAGINIIKISIALEPLLMALKEMALYGEGRFMEEDKKNLEVFEIDSEWFLLLFFVLKLVMIAVCIYFIFLYGALKARDILKAHQTIKRTL